MLRQAFDYKRWADERTLRAIEAIDRNSFPDSYEFALQQINHMVIVEELFAGRLTGASAPHSSTNTEVVPEFGDLERRLENLTNGMQAMFLNYQILKNEFHSSSLTESAEP